MAVACGLGAVALRKPGTPGHKHMARNPGIPTGAGDFLCHDSHLFSGRYSKHPAEHLSIATRCVSTATSRHIDDKNGE
jgi:hypothetical protein